ncbi:HupE/UreJ family protein [Telluria aromaticivorans]|uniref:HupE/UreJ family protein n=1 Tax=Telluria aromaticivorans TaxID=2725995 RepID=A0A7Y2JYQ7_9BURK|nr:HupE/UreJ family protein [Telluria aromaticivorans]NNG22863.1 HupE/UreJ family protein [Telluria aromaticivorans]
MKGSWCVLLALLALLSGQPAYAHKASDSYLNLEVRGQQVEGRWDIALRDLEMAVGLDGNGDGELTWDEVRGRHAAIAAYALARLKLNSDGSACPLQVTQQLVDSHTDGAYTVLMLRGSCSAAVTRLDIDYSLLADIDPQHKGLLALRHGSTTSTAIFSPEQPHQKLQLADPSAGRQFLDYLKHGVWHIWIGFDHILFLLSLLLPAVLVWRDKAWHGRDSLRGGAIEVVRIVTAFTLAHSITLTLASLGIVTLPSRLVESAIAASVIVAALNNVWPIVHRGRAWFAFGFGLLHGFGFASVLAGLGLPQDALLLSLVGFNVGVELGQLAIVAAFLPVAYLLRNGLFYRRAIMVGGSSVIALLAGVWLAERVFDLSLLA